MSDRSLSRPDRKRLSRRTFLRAAGVTGAVALSPAVIRRAAEAQEIPSPIRPDPAAKRGGTLRYGILSAPAHFDVHQSGTVANIGAQSPMYDCLIRRDPRDGQTVIPDLAWKWDIAPDGKKYTFYLRKGVKFHDGADFTAEDVKATYERIVRPPKGVVIPRSSLFTTVGDIVILDPHRIEFRMTEPRPKAFMLGAFASGWNIIVRKKSLDDNQGNLRQVMNYPGTGPFKHVSRQDKEVWIMERNANYWNKGLPYVDKLEVYRGLGTREVWVFEDGRFTIYRLRGERYVTISASLSFPEIDLARIAHYAGEWNQPEALRAYEAELRRRRRR